MTDGTRTLEGSEDDYNHWDEISLADYELEPKEKMIVKGGANGNVFSFQVKAGVLKKIPKTVVVKDIPIFHENEKYRVWELQMAHMQISRHPNIVRLYCFKEDSCYLKLIMERCLGNLDDLCFKKMKKKFTIGETRFLCRQIAKGLVYLHEKGFIHRDMKPENVLYEDNKGTIRLKIADFSFSRPNGPGNKTALGTEIYMAPEILNARDGSTDRHPMADYKEEIDIFSTGAIFYEIFFRTKLFGHKEQKDLNKLMEILAAFNSTISNNDFLDILTKMLQFHKSDRIKSEDLLSHQFFIRNDEADDAKLKSSDGDQRELFNFDLELYEPAFVVGMGAFGHVICYRLKNAGEEKANSLPANVAVKKVVSFRDLDSYDARRNMLVQREIYVSRELNHENVVHFYGFQQDQFYTYIIMEMGSCNLRSFHKRWGQFDSKEITFIGKQIACGLQYLHSRRIVYRNVNPESILVLHNKDLDPYVQRDLSRSTIKICGFGLSRFAPETESDEGIPVYSVVGTQLYMAPEVARSIEEGRVYFEIDYMKADVFSTGVVIHELIKSRAPFTVNELIGENISGLLSKRVDFNDSGLTSLVRGMLASDPGARLSMKEVYERFCQMSIDK